MAIVGEEDMRPAHNKMLAAAQTDHKPTDHSMDVGRTMARNSS